MLLRNLAYHGWETCHGCHLGDSRAHQATAHNSYLVNLHGLHPWNAVPNLASSARPRTQVGVRLAVPIARHSRAQLGRASLPLCSACPSRRCSPWPSRVGQALPLRGPRVRALECGSVATAFANGAAPAGPSMSSEKGGVKPPHSKAGFARKCPNSMPSPLGPLGRGWPSALRPRARTVVQSFARRTASGAGA